MTTTLGNPFLLKLEVSPVIVCVVAVLSGTASGHLLAMSMYVRKNSQPPLDMGNGPIISTHMIKCLSYHFSLYHECRWFPVGYPLTPGYRWSLRIFQQLLLRCRGPGVQELSHWYCQSIPHLCNCHFGDTLAH